MPRTISSYYKRFTVLLIYGKVMTLLLFLCSCTLLKLSQMRTLCEQKDTLWQYKVEVHMSLSHIFRWEIFSTLCTDPLISRKKDMPSGGIRTKTKGSKVDRRQLPWGFYNYLLRSLSFKDSKFNPRQDSSLYFRSQRDEVG